MGSKLSTWDCGGFLIVEKGTFATFLKSQEAVMYTVLSMKSSYRFYGNWFVCLYGTDEY